MNEKRGFWKQGIEWSLDLVVSEFPGFEFLWSPWFYYFWVFVEREREGKRWGFLDFWLLGIERGVPVGRGNLCGRRIGSFTAGRMREGNPVIIFIFFSCLFIYFIYFSYRCA